MSKHIKLTDMTVSIQAQSDPTQRVLHCKVLVAEEEKIVLIVENAPRGPRSTELLRTRHSRLVRTPQGGYTLTFRFLPTEDNLCAVLQTEIREIAAKGLPAFAPQKGGRQ